MIITIRGEKNVVYTAVHQKLYINARKLMSYGGLTCSSVITKNAGTEGWMLQNYGEEG